MPVEYVKKGHVAIITMNRPEARNAINGEMAATMEAALDQMESDPEVWVGILTAVGKAFCAGADLKEISAGNGAALSTRNGGFAGIARRERTKPLIAAITGSALAGGTEVALSCDMIIAADDTNFGLPEVKRSLVAGAGGLFRLPRVIGKAAALEVILTGDPLSSQRAYELGMVNKVVPEAEVMAEAEKLAARITAMRRLPWQPAAPSPSWRRARQMTNSRKPRAPPSPASLTPKTTAKARKPSSRNAHPSGRASKRFPICRTFKPPFRETGVAAFVWGADGGTGLFSGFSFLRSAWRMGPAESRIAVRARVRLRQEAEGCCEGSSVLALHPRLAAAEGESLDGAAEGAHFLLRPLGADQGVAQVVGDHGGFFGRVEIAGAVQFRFEMF